MRTFTVVSKIRDELKVSDGVKTNVLRPYYEFAVCFGLGDAIWEGSVSFWMTVSGRDW